MFRKMKEFLNHPYWKFPIWEPLGVLVGIIAIVITYAIFLRSQEIKDIQIVTLANTSLVDINNAVKSQISIAYEGKTTAITNLSLIQVEVENSGTIPITVQDFVKPITFFFPKGSDVLDARVTATSPEIPDVKLSVQNGSGVTISPLLLNPSDKLIIQFIVANIPATLTVNDCFRYRDNYSFAWVATEEAATQQAYFYPTTPMPEDSSIVGTATPMALGIDACIPITVRIPTYQVEARIDGISNVTAVTAISEQSIVTHNITISFVFFFCLVLGFAFSWTHWRNTNDNLASSIWKSTMTIFISLILSMILLGCFLLVSLFQGW